MQAHGVAGKLGLSGGNHETFRCAASDCAGSRHRRDCKSPACPAAAPPAGPAAASPPAAQTLQARTLWRKQQGWRACHRGCFETTYPSTQWREVPCKSGPAQALSAAPEPASDGRRWIERFRCDGAWKIFSADGSFSSVTGVTSETGSVGGANTFSLQLNTNLFKTATCAGAKAPDCMELAAIRLFQFGRTAHAILAARFRRHLPGGVDLHEYHGQSERLLSQRTEFSPARRREYRRTERIEHHGSGANGRRRHDHLHERRDGDRVLQRRRSAAARARLEHGRVQRVRRLLQ